MKQELQKIREAFQWTFDNMGKEHTPDHFNIPANGIEMLDRLMSESPSTQVADNYKMGNKELRARLLKDAPEFVKNHKGVGNNNLSLIWEIAAEYGYNQDRPSTQVLAAKEFAQDFKEIKIYLNDLYQQETSGLPLDAGNLWIAFTDKFNDFERRVLAATALQLSGDAIEKVFGWIEDVNVNGVGEMEDHKIVLCDGEFYWECDKDGDQPISPKEMARIYQQVKQ